MAETSNAQSLTTHPDQPDDSITNSNENVNGETISKGDAEPAVKCLRGGQAKGGKKDGSAMRETQIRPERDKKKDKKSPQNTIDMERLMGC